MCDDAANDIEKKSALAGYGARFEEYRIANFKQ